MKKQKYEFEENIVDTKLLEKDAYTFAVLEAIVNRKSSLVVTDHENYIICYSCAPFPLWLWTKEGITEGQKEEIWNIFLEEKLLPEKNDKYPITKINMKYEMADYFMKKSEGKKGSLIITMNMMAYECLTLITPNRKVDGSLVQMKESDLSDVAEFMYQFKQEVGMDIESLEACREHSKGLIGAENFFLWKNEFGENVAICDYQSEGKNARVGLVFCRKDCRRKGYAQRIVYEATKKAIDLGLIPMLYTDADYSASNECYKKLGYELRGTLCTIGKVE